MLTVLLAATLAQTRVVVIDVSAPDAIYEDVSRGLAEQVVEALTRADFVAERIDESELPPEGCRVGPCLGVVARKRKAAVVVTLDAVELDASKSQVAVAAMRSTDGLPLAVAKYVADGAKPRAPKPLRAFTTHLTAELAKLAQ